MNRTIVGAALALAVAAMPAASRLSAQTADTFTAKATAQGDSVNTASIAITIVVNRYNTEAEHLAVRNALNQSSDALRAALKGMPAVGSMTDGKKTSVLKYAYKRPNSQSITLLSDEPVAYLDPGVVKDKPKAGYDFALAILDFSTPGFGVGELDPAVKVSLTPAGMIVTQSYGATRVRLTMIAKKK
jgi:hypothetical protein